MPELQVIKAPRKSSSLLLSIVDMTMKSVYVVIESRVIGIDKGHLVELTGVGRSFHVKSLSMDEIFTDLEARDLKVVELPSNVTLSVHAASAHAAKWSFMHESERDELLAELDDDTNLLRPYEMEAGDIGTVVKDGYFKPGTIVYKDKYGDLVRLDGSGDYICTELTMVDVMLPGDSLKVSESHMNDHFADIEDDGQQGMAEAANDDKYEKPREIGVSGQEGTEDLQEEFRQWMEAKERTDDEIQQWGDDHEIGIMNTADLPASPEEILEFVSGLADFIKSPEEGGVEKVDDADISPQDIISEILDRELSKRP